MNEQGLKALENLGAELGAVKAENEAMRKVLSQAYSALYDWAPRSGKEMRAKNCCVLLLMDALSQQAEHGPDYSDGCEKEGFVGGCERMGCCGHAEPAPAQDESNPTSADYLAARAALESCDWSKVPIGTKAILGRVVDLLWLAAQASPAQTEQQPLIYINPMVIDELEGKRKASPGGLTWSRKALAHWTFPLYAAPIAQKVDYINTSEQQPFGYVIAKCDPSRDGYTCTVNPVREGKYQRPVYATPIAQTAPQPEQSGKFAMHQRVRKTSGSEWIGRIVGTYSTELTPEGYAVESEAHLGSVQIYPAKALERHDS